MKSNEVKDRIVKAFVDFVDDFGINRQTSVYHSGVKIFVAAVEAVIDAYKAEPAQLEEVSKEEAHFLKGTFDSDTRITALVYDYVNEWLDDHVYHSTAGDLESHLLRAYVNGYTVRKEKRYNIKVPHTRFYYWKWQANEPGVDALTQDDKDDERYQFTEEEIEHYHLEDCERVEVTDHD